MCSRPGRGRCLNGGGAFEAASSTSHWFQPANIHGSPRSSKVFPSPATRTNASEARHVVERTWSDTSRPGSSALCAPPCICARNQDASWSRSCRAGGREVCEACEEAAPSAAAGRGRASATAQSARTARRESRSEASRARGVMVFGGRTRGSREGASMAVASMSRACVCARLMRFARAHGAETRRGAAEAPSLGRGSASHERGSSSCSKTRGQKSNA
mmetsp:Transcript_5823/g.23581  ORF Transcript_5823/g.23581 Transcript_5823/m.23581 type:complete len:217 (+) Transcript_5823:1134-1784(+)